MPPTIEQCFGISIIDIASYFRVSLKSLSMVARKKFDVPTVPAQETTTERKCERCWSTDITDSEERGESVCMECGTLYSIKNQHQGQACRRFTGEADRNTNGVVSNPMYTTQTCTGVQVLDRRLNAYREKTFARETHDEYKKAQARSAKKEIETFVENHRLPANLIEKASKMFLERRMASDKLHCRDAHVVLCIIRAMRDNIKDYKPPNKALRAKPLPVKRTKAMRPIARRKEAALYKKAMTCLSKIEVKDIPRHAYGKVRRKVLTYLTPLLLSWHARDPTIRLRHMYVNEKIRTVSTTMFPHKGYYKPRVKDVIEDLIRLRSTVGRVSVAAKAE